jgi:hypothetical protein
MGSIIDTVALKLGLLDAPPPRLAWMRFLLGGLVIALWGWSTGRMGALRSRATSGGRWACWA